MKGMSQTRISWWHLGFLHKLSQHPQPTHHTLDLQPSTPHLSTPMTTNNNSPCCSQLTAAEAKETLSPWLHQTLALALPSQQNSVNDTTNLSAMPTAQPVFGRTRCLPKVLVTSVERGCAWLSVSLNTQLWHCNSLLQGRKISSKTLSCSHWQCLYITHTHTYMRYFSTQECYFACEATRVPDTRVPRGWCRSLEIKTHPLPLVPQHTPKAFTLQSRFLWAFY